MEQIEQIQQRGEIKILEKKLKSLRANLKVNLELVGTDKQGLKSGTRRNGKKYAVRENRDRFFYPYEWMTFFDALKKKQKLTFEFLINTGARINEARHVKVGDIDFERGNIILRVTKIKARKKEKNPRPRTISISSQFSKHLRRYVIEKKLTNEQYLGLLSTPAAHIAMKNCLERVGINDWYMFSIHNIRKTHGNWLKALGVEMGEICSRLGHDYNTFLKAYVSPDIFSFKDKQEMRMILGDLGQK